MKPGFICMADNGKVQLDSIHTAMTLIRKQSFNCPRVQKSGTGVIETVPFPMTVHANTRLIAARADFWVRIGGQNYKNGSGNAYVQLPFYKTPSGNITVWEFGDAPVKQWNERMGIVVINPDTNKVTYNSNWAIANILDFRRVTINGGWSMALPNNGSNCAVVIGGGGAYRADYDEFVEFNSLFWRINGNKLEIQSDTDRFARPGILGGANPSHFSMPLFILIVDTTGI
ncbi:hypothetical protein VP018_000409 [Morganella morganii]|nr:hypothetical protein [Morganella morganii]